MTYIHSFISACARLYNHLRGTFLSFPTYKKLYTLGFFIVGIIAVIAGVRVFIASRANSATIPPTIKEVTLMSVADLQESNHALELTGTLRSKSEQDLRFEIPGRVTGVYVKVGQRVSRGTIIAEVENSAQRAAVMQALGGLQAAQAQAKAAGASLTKIQGGTREEQMKILQASVLSAEDGTRSAEASARNALTSAYGSTEQAVLYGSDTLLYNATEYNPRPKFTVYDTTLKNDISALRVDIRKILARQHTAMGTTNSDVISEIDATIKELEYINNFYTKLFSALNDAVIAPETESAYAQVMTGSRATVLGTISALTGAKSALQQAHNQLSVAKANLEQGVTGAQKEDVQAVEAQRDAALAAVTSAQGSYSATLSALEKTRVRASIAGTLASFSGKSGDFVGTQTIGRIVGSGGAEVVFYIPENDSTRIAVGDTVLVADTIGGAIVSVATDAGGASGQLEVHADLDEAPASITNNSTVSVRVLANTDDTLEATPVELFVPLSAIKFTASETYVFTVADPALATSTLVATPVTLGTVVGNTVVISGIDAQTRIVTDARGLSATQTVSIK